MMKIKFYKYFIASPSYTTKEIGKPRYAIDLLHKVTNLSVQMGLGGREIAGGGV